MGIITLVEYAHRHGRLPASVSQLAQRGSFATARKMGRDWVIDEDEPYPDRRVKSGKYRNWRKRDGDGITGGDDYAKP